jgi:hypothetical protein
MYLLSKCCHGVFYVFSSTLNKIIYTFILLHWNCVTCQQTHTMNMKMAICFTSSHKKQGVRLLLHVWHLSWIIMTKTFFLFWNWIYCHTGPNQILEFFLYKQKLKNLKVQAKFYWSWAWEPVLIMRTVIQVVVPFL